MRRIAIALLLIAFLPTITMAYAGYALQFDGIDDRIEFGNNFMLNGSSFTVEFWINTTQTTQGFIVSKHICNYWNGWLINLNEPENGSLCFYKGYDGGEIRLLSNTAINNGLWHHVACVYNNNGNMNVYIDGLLSSSRTCPTDMETNSAIFMMGFSEGVCPYPLQGSLDEFRIWNTAKSQIDIQSAMRLSLIGNEPGLIGYWNFDEGLGDIAIDRSLSGLDGRLGSTIGPDASDPTWVVSDAPLARTWHVSISGSNETGDGSETNPFRTIQYGINTSNDGDTVLVAPGIYNVIEAPIWGEGKSNLVIMSQAGPDNTAIISNENSGYNHTTFWFEACGNIAVIGFPITHNPPNAGGGIDFRSPLPGATNNIVKNCKIYGCNWPLMASAYSNRLGIAVYGNKFYDNTGTSYPAITINGLCDALIDSNEIFNNSANGATGILCSGNALISRNKIYNNAGNYNPGGNGGGAIQVEPLSIADSVIIASNVIYSNTGTKAGAISIRGKCTLLNNIIFDNYAANGGSGIYVYRSGSIVTVANNDIFNNTGYGILSDSSWVLAENNYWGHGTGPYNQDFNPGGIGNAVSSNVDFTPWSAVPINVENRPPSEVSILSPSAGQTCHLDSWLTWTKSVDLDTFDVIHYHLQVDNNPAFTDPEIDTDSLPDALALDQSVSFHLGSLDGSAELAENQSYYWRVRAFDMFSDSSEWTDGSHWFYFSATNDPPNPPVSGFSPCCFEEVISLTPTVTWDDAIDPDNPSDSLRYIIELCNEPPGDDECFTVFYDTTGPGINRHTCPDTLLDNSKFAYRIMTLDPAGLVSEWSETQFFWTNHYNFPPEPFPLLSPGEGQRRVDYFTRFSWGNTVDYDPNSSFSFTLECSPDSLFRFGISAFSSLTDTALAIPTDSLTTSPGSAYWRVWAVDDDSLARLGGLPEGARALVILPAGDANANGVTNGIDVTYMVNFLKGVGPAPDPILAGDANGNCTTNGIDVTYLVNYLKGIGSAPIRGNCGG